jgi:hypothetical protein
MEKILFVGMKEVSCHLAPKLCFAIPVYFHSHNVRLRVACKQSLHEVGSQAGLGNQM